MLGMSLGVFFDQEGKLNILSKLRRLNQIFASDGRAVVAALDGFVFSKATTGIDATSARIARLVDAGLDAALVTYGQAQTYEHELTKVTTILRVDASTDVYDPSIPKTAAFFDVNDALKLDAAGIVCMTFPGADSRESESHQMLARLARQAAEWSMPVIAETLPFGYPITSTQSDDPHYIAAAARFSAELGADIIKTRFTGTADDALIVKNASRPVLALGGPKTDTLTYFKFVYHCIEVGARGVAVGRNITQDPNPVGMVAALHALVHENVKPELAFDIYKNLSSIF